MRIAGTRAWMNAALICIAMLALPCAAQSRQRIVQLAEDGVQTRRIPARSGPLADAPVTRVCENGARWLRLDFSELTLRGYDALMLSSSGGDRFVFQGGQWNQRSFSTRALRGSCIDIRPSFGSAHSRYRVGSYQFGTQALEDMPVVVAG